MRKTLIIGMGKSGISAYDFLQEEGDIVVGVDDNPALVKHLLAAGKKVAQSADVQNFDRLILSPGVPSTHALVKQAEILGIPVIGEIDLALQYLHQPAVAITGTNGKTTVTLLIAHILQTARFSAHALGNVGVPLTSYVKKAQSHEIAIIELSSYQLEKLDRPLFDIGLILNITPDHLDRYGTVREYAKAKCRLQDNLKKGGELWIHESVALEFRDLLTRSYQTYGRNRDCTLWTDQVALLRNSYVETILPTRYRNLGPHESENILAAWIVCQRFGVRPEIFLEAAETFRKPLHRIEWVRTVRGVDYINDSKGTNIDATIKAVESMQKPIILIAGGVDKGASYQSLKPFFQNKVRYVIALGQAAPKIADDLKPEYTVDIVYSLRDAIHRAEAVAQEGDAVLLSPACSSFDMFRDYAHRGDEFKRIVCELKEK